MCDLKKLLVQSETNDQTEEGRSDCGSGHQARKCYFKKVP
jgi:hypothetical protein